MSSRRSPAVAPSERSYSISGAPSACRKNAKGLSLILMCIPHPPFPLEVFKKIPSPRIRGCVLTHNFSFSGAASSFLSVIDLITKEIIRVAIEGASVIRPAFRNGFICISAWRQIPLRVPRREGIALCQHGNESRGGSPSRPAGIAPSPVGNGQLVTGSSRQKEGSSEKGMRNRGGD